MISFEGQVALVTGAGRGLGLAYAKLLAERGARVVIHDVGADKDGIGGDLDIAETAAMSLRQRGFAVSPASGAIGNREGCRGLIEDTLARHGRLDVLIHNAGWVAYRSIEALDVEFLNRMVAIGVGAPLWLAQAAWAAMKAQRYGRILLTTSDRAIFPQYAQEGLSAYAAAKMAAVGITNILAAEGAAHGILVNAISPVAKTRMWGVQDEPDDLHPDAVAPGAVYLVSRSSSHSGCVLRASNGQFQATRAVEEPGVDYPRDLRAVSASSLEAVQSAWGRIASTSRRSLSISPSPPK